MAFKPSFSTKCCTNFSLTHHIKAINGETRYNVTVSSSNGGIYDAWLANDFSDNYIYGYNVYLSASGGTIGEAVTNGDIDVAFSGACYPLGTNGYSYWVNYP